MRTRLEVAAVVFVVANLLHTADHLRQGTGRLTTEIFAGGSVLTVSAFVVLVLALRHDRHAALFAAVVGVSSALGIAASHLAPHWSAFSDPYPDLSVDALSWAVMLAEIGAAVVLGVVGIREVSRQPSPSTRAAGATTP
jgi:hypothetical protein